MIDPDEFHRVIDMVYEVPDVGRRPPLVEFRPAAVVLGALLVGQIAQCAAAEPGDSQLFTQGSQRLAFLRRIDFYETAQSHGLHHPTVFLQSQQLLVVHISSYVGKSLRTRVRRNDRRPRETGRIEHRVLRDM